MLKEVAGGLTPNFEILVVDTMQPRDQTPSVCQRLGVTYLPRRGGDLYGDAVRRFRRRSGPLGRDDGRGRFAQSARLPQLWEYRQRLRPCHRFPLRPGGQTENPALLIFMSQIVNVVFRLALRLKCYDVSNSFRLYRGADVRALQTGMRSFRYRRRDSGKARCLAPATFESRKSHSLLKSERREKRSDNSYLYSWLSRHASGVCCD